MSDITLSPTPGIINLVLFYCSARTGHFGQGTFVNTVLSLVGDQENIKVTIINTDARDVQEVTFIAGREMDKIKIPCPENGLMLNTRGNIIQKAYARRIVDISVNYLQEKDNIVFWFNSIDFLNVAAEIRGRFEGVKLFYVHHAWSWKHFKNIADETFGEKLLNDKKGLDDDALEFTGYQQQMTSVVDKTIVVTKHAKYFFEKYLGVPPERITAIYNAIDPATIPVKDGVAIRKRYGFGADEKIILYSGRVAYEKGLPFLLKAFKLIAGRNEKARLVVVGTGRIPEYISLAAPYWSRVTYTGELDHDQVFELYNIADVGVQPSLIEQCSFTAIEMCFHRIPLVVSGDIGLDEMFEDRKDALKVKVNYDEKGIKYLDEEEIAEKIEYLLKNPELARRLGNRAFEKAASQFHISVMKEKYLEVLHGLTEVVI